MGGSLTPQVVITGSLNTLQQSWQHSFTEGCSANTSGSCTKQGKGGVRGQDTLVLCGGHPQSCHQPRLHHPPCPGPGLPSGARKSQLQSVLRTC
jgi:hypothetical protein